MQPAEIQATAYDATVDIGPPTGGDDPLQRLELADAEARDLVERMQAKVEKQQAHLDGALQCLADAEAEAERAAAELDAYRTE
jgi:hypothetical protein